MRGVGRVMFAGVLLLIVGTLNIVYGIGALDDANIFLNEKRYIFTDLNTMGWVLLILGIIQLSGGFSLLAGNAYGRVIGIVAGSLGAIAALFSIGGNDPWWSLAIFFLSVWVVHGIIIYGADEKAALRDGQRGDQIVGHGLQKIAAHTACKGCDGDLFGGRPIVFGIEENDDTIDGILFDP